MVRLIPILLLAGTVSTALAAPTSSPSPSPKPTPLPPISASATYALPPIDYFIELLPGPPRNGSFRDRMDFRDVVARQAEVTPKEMASIQATYLFNAFTFSKVFGPEFTAQDYPMTAAFFSKLINTANVVVNELKNHYKRPRPFIAHPQQVRLLVPNEPGYSYPSGHTTRSRLAAFTMADLEPAARMQLFKVAETVANDRITAGEHYLTDLEGGRRLGKILYNLLSKDPRFQAELAAVKAAEWNPPPAITVRDAAPSPSPTPAPTSAASPSPAGN